MGTKQKQTTPPGVFEMPLKAKHFWNTSFTVSENCACSKALKELFPDAAYLCEYIYGTSFEHRGKIYDYKHKRYGNNLFRKDFQRAYKADGEEVIRTLTMVRVP